MDKDGKLISFGELTNFKLTVDKNINGQYGIVVVDVGGESVRCASRAPVLPYVQDFKNVARRPHARRLGEHAGQVCRPAEGGRRKSS